MTRCRLCNQLVTYKFEVQYELCSQCVTNYHQRPDEMDFEKWLTQFQPQGPISSLGKIKDC